MTRAVVSDILVSVAYVTVISAGNSLLDLLAEPSVLKVVLLQLRLTLAKAEVGAGYNI